MSSLGKLLLVVGIFLILAGLGLIIFSKLKITFLGKLPGDIIIQKKNFTFYFPLATCIVISIILSFIIYFFSKQ